MPEVKDKALEINATMADFAKMYKEDKSREMLHGIVIGDKGVGKTDLVIRTAPKPVFVFSFDPDGCKTVRDLEESGDVVVDRRYENDRPNLPHGEVPAYGLFATEFNRMKSIGFFDQFATVVLDSLTTFSNSLQWAILKVEGREAFDPATQRTPSSMADKGGQGMRRQEWQAFRNCMQHTGRCFNTLPCHTFMLAHLERYQNENTLIMEKSILLPGKSKIELTGQTSEVYHLLAQEKKDRPTALPEHIKISDDGIYRWLLTKNNGDYRGGTRVGGHGKFRMQEPASIYELLKRAGMSTDDKPTLTQTVGTKPTEGAAT